MIESETKQEFFSSRWALIIATIGIAVGTGNIWRFSRIVAQNGGGSFLIPWVIFLLIWSVPLIIAEFAIGKSARMGPVGAITKTAGNTIWVDGCVDCFCFNCNNVLLFCSNGLVYQVFLFGGIRKFIQHI